MKLGSAFKSFSTIKAQIFLLVLSVIIISFLFYKPLSEFRSDGQESFVEKITPDVINKWGKEPTPIKTGFLIHEFLQFDVIGNNFVMNGVVSFEFDPTKISQTAIDKFSFTKGDIIKKSDPIIKKISDNLVFVQYYVGIKFSTLFNYGMFPLDDHSIFLNLTNNALEAQNAIFQISEENFSVPKYVFLSGWLNVAHRAYSGYVEFSSQVGRSVMHPKIIFVFDIKKQDLRQLLLIFLPLLMLFYMSIFILAVKDLSTDLNTILFLITAFVANSIVIQGLSPKVGYFMLLDYFVLFFLINMFILFVVTFLGTLPEEKFSHDLLASIRGWAIIIVYTGLICLTYYLTHVHKIA